MVNVWESMKQAPWYYLLELPKETIWKLFKLREEDFRKFDEIFNEDGGTHE